MRILLTGASGFIGARLVGALRARGYEVVCTAHHAKPKGRTTRGCPRVIAADFMRARTIDFWLPRLEGIDVVINAVGILRERDGQTFAALHRDAPRALFAAAAQARAKLIVQISALGADERAATAYHLTKRDADSFLATLNVPWVIVQPSLVYGEGGASARLFALLATLPMIPLPGRGEQPLQPIHIDDAVAAIVTLIEAKSEWRRRIPLVGPEALTLRDLLARLRASFGLPRARFLPVPLAVMRLVAAAGRYLPDALLDPETLQMLLRGSTADAGATHRLLQRPPRSVEEFVPEQSAAPWRVRAKLDWLLPTLRLSIAFIWIATGILSLGVYPVAESYALLARLGIHGTLAPGLLYGAALLDLALGVAVLRVPRRRWLWLAQMVVIIAYSALIAWRLPEFWIHPYGPLIKNIPMLAAIWLLYEFEER